MAFPLELVLENPNGQNPKWTPFWQKSWSCGFPPLGTFDQTLCKTLFFHSFWVVSKPVFFFSENLGDDDPGTSRQEVSWQGVLPDVVESTRSCLETMVTGDRGEFHRTKGLI